MLYGGTLWQRIFECIVIVDHVDLENLKKLIKFEIYAKTDTIN